MTPTAIARIAQLVEKWRNQRDKFGLARGSAEQCADDLEKIIISALSQDAEPVRAADAWLIIHYGKDGKETREVVLSPLTDDAWMDEGDEAIPLYSSPLPVNAEAAAREVANMLKFKVHGMDVQWVGPKRDKLETEIAAIIRKHSGQREEVKK